jgi:hypothetical protein
MRKQCDYTSPDGERCTMAAVGTIGAEGDEEPNAVCEVHSNRESYWPPGFRFVPFVG